MRLLCIYIGENKHDTTQEIQDLYFISELSHFHFWERSHREEALRFGASVIAQRTTVCVRQVVEEDSLRTMAQCFPSYSIAITTDLEYPLSTAWSIITSIHRMMEEKKDMKRELGACLQEYQNPKNADKMMHIQGTLDEIKVIMHKNIETLLSREETIESLVQKTDKLKESSKIFYTQPNEKINVVKRGNFVPKLHPSYSLIQCWSFTLS
jgi:hypothetical protein